VITGNLTSVICHTSNAIRDTSQITLHLPHIKRHRPRVIRHVTSNDMEPRYCCVSLLPSNTSLTNAAAAAAAASSFFTRSCSKLPLPNFDLRCWLLPMHCESTSNVTLHTPDVKGKKSHATCHTSKVTLSRPFTMIPMRVQSASASSILQIVKP
jgi:hypothetical protein